MENQADDRNDILGAEDVKKSNAAFYDRIQLDENAVG